MDFPHDSSLPRSINTYWSPYTASREVLRFGGASDVGASTSWAVANRAYYIPFWLPWPYPVRRVFWGNGSAITGNKDFGIYSIDGTRIYSTGSTAEVGTSVLQYVTPTEFLLYPGRYYMAISCSITTNHCWGVTGSLTYNAIAGLQAQDTALPLPATATFATAGTPIPFCGITRYVT